MSTKKTSPAVQSAESDEALAGEWRRLCRTNGCTEDELQDTEAALRELGPELTRLRLSQAIARLSGASR